MAKEISFAEIEEIKKVFEQKGIPLNEIDVVYVDGKPYYMWPVEKASKYKVNNNG